MRLVALIVLVAAWLPGFSSAGTVLVLGDSISAAYGLEESDGWVSLLEKSLQKNLPDTDVVNASISGETTAGGLQRLPQALDRFTPDVVVIELGGNDGLRGYSLKLMKKNLLGMIGLVRQAGAEPLILGMRIPTNYGEYYTERFFDVYRKVADESNTALVPFLLAGIATERKYFQADGVHPTAAAQPLMLDLVLPSISRLLESASAVE